MDMNLTVLAGKLAAPPELRRFESGSCLVRLLVTARSSSPRRRVDVIPITLWDPPKDHEIIDTAAGHPVWVVGTVQRRFWSVGEDRKSRREVVAHHVELVNSDAAASTTERSAAGDGT